MAKIAFILLCHKDPVCVIEQARCLSGTGDYVAVHVDARAPSDVYQDIETGVADCDNVALVKDRVKCGWGEWSLVQATLNALTFATARFGKATHFYLLSGDCMPIKSAAYAHDILDSQPYDFIENHDFFESDWIQASLKEGRLYYHHWFNERKYKSLFYFSFELQKRLGLKRNTPPGLQMMIGSQWWCLRRATIEKILEFCRTRRDVMRFFSTTWIPDETFFQTLVAHLVPRDQITNRTLTLKIFGDYGLPVVFHNDHYDLLLRQDALFARKISPDAQDLKHRLAQLWAAPTKTFAQSESIAVVYDILRRQGRVGKRFGPRAWHRDRALAFNYDLALDMSYDQRLNFDYDLTLAVGYDLFVILSPDRAVAQKMMAAASSALVVPGLGYIFDDAQADMPDLGGIGAMIEKRNQQPTEIIDLLFDYYTANRLILCVDPHNMPVIDKLAEKYPRAKFLEINCDINQDDLVDMAVAMGMIGPDAPQDVQTRILPLVKVHMHDAFADMFRAIHMKHPTRYTHIKQSDPPDLNARILVDFFMTTDDIAVELAHIPDLLCD